MIYLRIPFSCFFQVLYHSINTGVRGTCPPMGVGGGAPASPGLHPTDERGERGGAAAAPAGRGLPQEARAARSRGEGENRCRRYALKRGFGGTCPPTGVGGGAPANGTCPPDRAAGTETLQCATSSIRAILLRSLSAHPNCPTDKS